MFAIRDGKIVDAEFDPGKHPHGAGGKFGATGGEKGGGEGGTVHKDQWAHYYERVAGVYSKMQGGEKASGLFKQVAALHKQGRPAEAAALAKKAEKQGRKVEKTAPMDDDQGVIAKPTCDDETCDVCRHHDARYVVKDGAVVDDDDPWPVAGANISSMRYGVKDGRVVEV